MSKSSTRISKLSSRRLKLKVWAVIRNLYEKTYVLNMLSELISHSCLAMLKNGFFHFQDKFSINPKTGAIKTVKGLDFELSRSHMLIIGTEEGRAGGGSLLNSVKQVIFNWIRIFSCLTCLLYYLN